MLIFRFWQKSKCQNEETALNVILQVFVDVFDRLLYHLYVCIKR